MTIAHKKGFLLIELILAVSLLSIGLVLVLRSLLSSSSAAGIISQRISFLELIETRAANALELAANGRLKEGLDSHEVDLNGQRARLDMRVEPVEMGEARGVKEVTIGASRNLAGSSVDEKLVTYMKSLERED